VVWFLLFVLLHESLHRYWGRWFRLSAEQFDFLNFAGMMLLKIFILVVQLSSVHSSANRWKSD